MHGLIPTASEGGRFMKKDRFITTLWGLGAAAMLALGLFVSGDQPGPRSLTCTDLLNMPLEALMEVRIVSSDGGTRDARQSGDARAWPDTGAHFSPYAGNWYSSI
jgi:hypothetical protein